MTGILIMKNRTDLPNPDYHVRGCYPSRILDPMTDSDEMMEPVWIAVLTGCAAITVAVYGHGLCESDVEEVAGETVATGSDSWMIYGPYSD